MADAWEELQALKSKRDSRRKRLEERKKERQHILQDSPHLIKDEPLTGGNLTATFSPGEPIGIESSAASLETHRKTIKRDEGEIFVEGLESEVLSFLSDLSLHLPMDSRQLLLSVNKNMSGSSSPEAQHNHITNLLQKFAVQLLISIEEKVCEEGTFLEIISADHAKLSAMIMPAGDRDHPTSTSFSTPRKRKADESCDEVSPSGFPAPAEEKEKAKDNDVLSLLSLASTREKENKRIGEEILELLSRPSAKEKTLAERFRSQGSNVVKEFCPHGTKSECRRVATNSKPCSRLHFRKIIQTHTDETLGDCSFLNTCFHMESCKYVHYQVDSTIEKGTGSGDATIETPAITPPADGSEPKSVLFPPQWLSCDLRFFDMTVLGKFSVIMADPPWDIHMELPYGTLSDDEMRQLNIPALQDEGLIFLWVTGRAMELGRECLELWGYERVDELIWVKTNQLQRIIRTGRTGHWLNHGKEHCLVGMKGNPPINRGLDCDVIVAEVRATSHKPDEVYGIIERLSPGTRKIELFGRPHNIQPNWITLGNQLDGDHIVDEEVRRRFYARYPDGNCTNPKS